MMKGSINSLTTSLNSSTTSLGQESHLANVWLDALVPPQSLFSLRRTRASSGSLGKVSFLITRWSCQGREPFIISYPHPAVEYWLTSNTYKVHTINTIILPYYHIIHPLIISACLLCSYGWSRCPALPVMLLAHWWEILIWGLIQLKVSLNLSQTVERYPIGIPPEHSPWAGLASACLL